MPPKKSTALYTHTNKNNPNNNRHGLMKDIAKENTERTRMLAEQRAEGKNLQEDYKETKANDKVYPDNKVCETSTSESKALRPSLDELLAENKRLRAELERMEKLDKE